MRTDGGSRSRARSRVCRFFEASARRCGRQAACRQPFILAKRLHGASAPGFFCLGSNDFAACAAGGARRRLEHAGRISLRWGDVFPTHRQGVRWHLSRMGLAPAAWHHQRTEIRASARAIREGPLRRARLRRQRKRWHVWIGGDGLRARAARGAQGLAVPRPRNRLSGNGHREHQRHADLHDGQPVPSERPADAIREIAEKRGGNWRGNAASFFMGVS
ncbi:MAG: hypothetical protein BWZ10_02050 [candidate division BRC1 bacterium ADurb.BinA364]|nr:MAG: hypothetical protein BWZ10_02050 [candidate division BRC1 bacterium ADurb.BinA364]